MLKYESKTKFMDNTYNHNLIWTKIISAIIYPFVKSKFQMKMPKKAKLPDGGNLILSNHVTKYDQFFIAFYFWFQQIYYVSGENVFRRRLFRRFAEGSVGVIVHQRGITALGTINSMMKRLKAGRNVMIFPEGAMTFDGRTKPVDASIAKVAKMSGANLVLFRIDGGYFAQPRWGKSIRKGQVKLEHIVITKEELKKMTAAQIRDAINNTLYVDAYESQEKNRIKYISKDGCEGLECCLYKCPKCHKLSELKSKGNVLFCECGYSAKYDDYGYLTDNGGELRTITRLSSEQRDYLKELISVGDNRLLFTDELECKKVLSDGSESYIGRLKLEAYPDHFLYEINGKKGTVSAAKISKVYVFFRNTLNVVIEGNDFLYECTGDFSFNALKYRDYYELIKER